MTFTLTICCDNSAFTDGRHLAPASAHRAAMQQETARILRSVAECVAVMDQIFAPRGALDINGNSVCSYRFED